MYMRVLSVGHFNGLSSICFFLDGCWCFTCFYCLKPENRRQEVDMRLAVISDVHLGRGDRTDRFGHVPRHFHQFLDYLEPISDRVVLLGDIVDTHHGRIPLAFWREFRAICAAYPGLSDRLLGGRYQVVAGNHDACLLELPGVTSELYLEEREHRVLFQHGHQLDRLITFSPKLCAMGNYLGGTAARYGLDGALELLDWIDNTANGGAAGRPGIYRDKAIELGLERQVPLVVMGHIHDQDHYARKGVTYMNVGACLEGRFEYGLVDLTTGSGEVSCWR